MQQWYLLLKETDNFHPLSGNFNVETVAAQGNSPEQLNLGAFSDAAA
jgi:hypothetical protein